MAEEERMKERGGEPGVRFRHLDGEKWQEVRALQQGDRRVSVREKWLEFTAARAQPLREMGPGHDDPQARPQQRSRRLRARGRDDVWRCQVYEGHAYHPGPGGHPSAPSSPDPRASSSSRS